MIIITDSTSDIFPEEAKKLDVVVIPLTVRFGDKEYKEGVDLSPKEFYEMLEASEQLPTTSQINPATFEETFSAYPDEDILGIFLSSKLSGTYQSACIAKDMLERDNIYLVDSLNATIGFHALVRAAVKLKSEGMSAKDIAKELEVLKTKVNVVAMVDTLKYLEKGGRISKVTSILGSLASINPMVTIDEGEVVCNKKVRGIKKAFAVINESLIDLPADEKYDIIIGSSNAPDRAESLLETIKDTIGDISAVISSLGSAVGTYTGPRAVGIGYIAR